MTQNITPPSTLVVQDTNVNEPDFGALEPGLSGFYDRRKLNKIYVDKTETIFKLCQWYSPIFIARPRRFGKSLLCSTLEDLFANGIAHFEGLAIDKLKLWEHETTYPVIKLRFSKGHVRADQTSFDQDVFRAMVRQLESSNLPQRLKEANIDLKELEQTNNNDLIGLIDDIVRQYKTQQPDGRCVIIIDEYDALINKMIPSQTAFNKCIEWFSDFYDSIKCLSEDGCLRFCFTTGITRYSHTDTLSGFNNLTDLSFEMEFCTLLGYTEDELQQYFGAYINYGAKLFGELSEDYLGRLRNEYDGYRFANSIEGFTGKFRETLFTHQNQCAA